MWDRTQQVAKAIRSSLGFSSYTALRHMHQRYQQFADNVSADIDDQDV